jgi:hypothetical protein
MSFADPVHLGLPGHILGDGSNEPCESCGIGVGDTRINGRWFCCDCVRKCVACSDLVADGENGTVDDEGQARCCWCHARELRQAHPAMPTTVNEYLKAKGEAA